MLSPLPADVVLYPEDSKELSSRLVAAGECLMGMGRDGRQYTHAAILSAQPGYEWEATFPFTGYFPVDTSRSYEIWRLGDPTDLQRTRILGWCMDHEGDLYNLIGVVTAGRIELRNTYFCSQFACLAYASAGLHPGDKIMDPDSIPEYPGAQMVLRYDPPNS